MYALIYTPGKIVDDKASGGSLEIKRSDGGWTLQDDFYVYVESSDDPEIAVLATPEATSCFPNAATRYFKGSSFQWKPTQTYYLLSYIADPTLFRRDENLDIVAAESTSVSRLEKAIATNPSCIFPGTIRDNQCLVFNSEGADAPIPLYARTNLEVVDKTSSSVKLQWNEVSDASDYQVDCEKQQ